jgi:hypothetical protein
MKMHGERLDPKGSLKAPKDSSKDSCVEALVRVKSFAWAEIGNRQARMNSGSMDLIRMKPPLEAYWNPIRSEVMGEAIS